MKVSVKQAGTGKITGFITIHTLSLTMPLPVLYGGA
jgi:hypothetical protein